MPGYGETVTGFMEALRAVFLGYGTTANQKV